MVKIVILDSDDFSALHVRSALNAVGLVDVCSVQSESDELASVHMRVGDVSDSGPAVLENDCFSRPLRIGALLDRVQKHHLDLTSHIPADFIPIGPFTLNVVSSRLIDDQTKNEIRLTEKEKNILVYLARHKTDVIGRQALLDEVWGYAETVETHTLETHIYRLRQKIEVDPTDPKVLLTDDQGYRLAD